MHNNIEQNSGLSILFSLQNVIVVIQTIKQNRISQEKA